MRTEMAFLKYRLEVVQMWPDSPRKTVFLTAIESRIVRERQEPTCPNAGTDWHPQPITPHPAC